MEELLTLKTLLQQGNIPEALLLVEDLEEISKSDKINKIFNLSVILLIHLIKKQAEQKTTRSWELSIYNSVKQIQRTNKRRKANGNYLTQEELVETLEDAYESALKNAALEAFGGKYLDKELQKMVNQQAIIETAIELIEND
ncbi:protein of unknown function DUF29 [Rippkaea orientalis PCC 8801]|uniref:DUF29 domain-containing protein n=1 Tax=Rippkaea orientalis (strain PCC 8801 / RF-1) TaxID=41431 RepID=B7JYF8_RIPO1|nr:DUF29 family protein [Rippkaea orientalis]ACK64117.1 protein of unknown function DUF29 [Rippkaea orientalis PCC 8801]